MSDFAFATDNLQKSNELNKKTFDLQPKTYCFGIDIRLLFLVSIAIPVNFPDFVGRLPILRISPDHPILTKNLPISRFSSRAFALKIN